MTLALRKALLAKARRLLRQAREPSPKAVAAIFRAHELLRREVAEPYDPSAVRKLDPASRRAFQAHRGEAHRICHKLNAMLEAIGLEDMGFPITRV